jgi:hypothetical protein
MLVESLSTSLAKRQLASISSILVSNSLPAGHYSLCWLRVAARLSPELAPLNGRKGVLPCAYLRMLVPLALSTRLSAIAPNLASPAFDAGVACRNPP